MSSRVAPLERIRGAARMLFGRGDNAIACSFCGRGKHAGETIVYGPGVAICAGCAHFALHVVTAGTDAQARAVEQVIGVTVHDVPASLLPACRATLEADLVAAAACVQGRLLGWSYTCDHEAGDWIAVSLARSETAADGHDIDVRFRRAFFAG